MPLRFRRSDHHWLTGWIYYPGTWIDVTLLALAAVMLVVDVAVLVIDLS